MKKWTADEIEIAVAHHFGVRQNIIVPNVSWGFGYLGHECDLLILSGSGYLTEIEIKVSKSDLKKDLEKQHNHKSDLIKSLYFAIPIDLLNYAIEVLPFEYGIITVEEMSPGNNPFNKAEIKRVSKIRNKFRKIGDNEAMQLTRLGCMRIFSLKSKIVDLRKRVYVTHASNQNRT